MLNFSMARMNKKLKIIFLVMAFLFAFELITKANIPTKFGRRERIWLISIGKEIRLLEGSLVESFREDIVIRCKNNDFVIIKLHSLSTRDKYYLISEEKAAKMRK